MVKNITLKVGDYVYAENKCYSCEGKIVSTCESSGARKGTLYEVEDKSGCNNHFFAEDITPLAMPTMYEPTLEDMAKEHFFLNGDKRVGRLDLYHNPTRTITKKANLISIEFIAYDKYFSFAVTLDEIKYNFEHKGWGKYAHIKAYHNR